MQGGAEYFTLRRFLLTALSCITNTFTCMLQMSYISFYIAVCTYLGTMDRECQRFGCLMFFWLYKHICKPIHRKHFHCLMCSLYQVVCAGYQHMCDKVIYF
jgi:hypothetical protein